MINKFVDYFFTDVDLDEEENSPVEEINKSNDKLEESYTDSKYSDITVNEYMKLKDIKPEKTQDNIEEKVSSKPIGISIDQYYSFPKGKEIVKKDKDIEILTSPLCGSNITKSTNNSIKLTDDRKRNDGVISPMFGMCNNTNNDSSYNKIEEKQEILPEIIEEEINIVKEEIEKEIIKDDKPEVNSIRTFNIILDRKEDKECKDSMINSSIEEVFSNEDEEEDTLQFSLFDEDNY